MKEPLTLAYLLKGWDQYQQHLTTTVAPLSAEQLGLQVAPRLRSVMTIAAHIIAARVWWFHFVMQEGPESLAPLVKWDDEGEPARSASELAAGLNQTWGVIQDCLNRWTPADLDQEFRYHRPGRNSSQSYTRQWIVWHVLEHDLHHGGELSFVLGAHDLPAIDL